MPADDLPPDPDSVEKWRQMPHNPPSKDALPPLVLKPGWILGVVIVIGILIVLGLLLQRGIG
jgi:hypothetical protein